MWPTLKRAFSPAVYHSPLPVHEHEKKAQQRRFPVRDTFRTSPSRMLVFLAAITITYTLGSYLRINAARDSVDWSRFAYSQYVTDSTYLCNSLMVFESLHRLGSRAARVMLYPAPMTADPSMNSTAQQMLAKARDEYKVRLVPVELVEKKVAEGHDGRRTRVPSNSATWAASFTKLLAFNQTEYARVLNIDSDATVLKVRAYAARTNQPMDELFLIPPAPVAVPRAYWLDDHMLSDQLILIEPSAREFARVQHAISAADEATYDMDIVSRLYHDSAVLIPHRDYNLLTGEFRSDKHHRYLGSRDEAWDAQKVLDAAKYVHFSDWPLPKPWVRAAEAAVNVVQPACAGDGGAPARSSTELAAAYPDLFSGYVVDAADLAAASGPGFGPGPDAPYVSAWPGPDSPEAAAMAKAAAEADAMAEAARGALPPSGDGPPGQGRGPSNPPDNIVARRDAPAAAIPPPCAELAIWLELYADFRRRRERVCGVGGPIV